MSDENNTRSNVIPFPQRGKQRSLRALYIERNRVVIVAALLSILVVVIFANNKILTPDRFIASVQNSQERGIASVRPFELYRNTKWEHEMAKKLSLSPMSRDVASIGKNPSALEEFQFGLLEGKYALQLKDEKIYRIEFTEDEKSEDRPKYVVDRLDFIEKNKSIFPVAFSSLKKVGDIVTKNEIHETYGLYDDSNRQVGTIFFKLDSFGRLISLSVE